MVELYEHKLKVVYMGLESGDQNILNYCKKRSTVDERIEAVNKMRPNYLSSGRFPKDKSILLDILKSAIKGKLALKPEFMRGCKIEWNVKKRV